jgi:hypothetical protein
VNPVAEAVKRLANPKAKAAGAACEAVELLVELGNFRGRGSWAELSELDVLGGWRSWDLRAGTPHDYWWL